MATIITGSDGFIGGAYAARHPNACRVERYEDLPAAPGAGPFVHIGAIPGVELCRDEPSLAFYNNVLMTEQYLHYALKHEQRFIFVSSAAADVPNTIYGATKAAGEALVRGFQHDLGLDAVIVRLANVYGPGSRHKQSVVAKMIRDAKTTGSISVNGDPMRSMVYIDDVLDALDDACTCSYPRMIVLGEWCSIDEVAHKLAMLVEDEIFIEYKAARPNDTAGIAVPALTSEWRHWMGKTAVNDGLKKTVEYFNELRDL